MKINKSICLVLGYGYVFPLMKKNPQQQNTNQKTPKPVNTTTTLETQHSEEKKKNPITLPSDDLTLEKF